MTAVSPALKNPIESRGRIEESGSQEAARDRIVEQILLFLSRAVINTAPSPSEIMNQSFAKRGLGSPANTRFLEERRNRMKDDLTERVAELADRHGRMVFATAYRVLGRAEEAEDVLQEVFLKVLQSWNGRLKPDTVQDWGAYLRVTAARCAVDLLRRKPKWENDGAEPPEELPAPPIRTRGTSLSSANGQGSCDRP